jgi:hypothetical protein
MPQRLWHSPGTIVYVWFFVFRHKGIVSNRRHNGKPMVIANSVSTRGVAEIPWDDFTTGLPCFREGYPSNLHPLQVLYNARELTGQPYSVAAFNCEHFVYKAHGLPPRSPQFAMTALVTAGISISLMVAAQS